ncbi:MAG: response regulator transcription factor [Actinomycetota bacterium]|nr:response regulator transcription factor [Actinomycetota bacterium]
MTDDNDEEGGPMAASVVVVDDTEHVRQMLVSMLTLDGFDVVGEGATGDEATDLAVKLEPDVLIIDYSMPGMNGLEASKKVLAALPQQNIILYTAYIDNALKEEAKRVGIALTIGKVEGLETLERSISELCLQMKKD